MALSRMAAELRHPALRRHEEERGQDLHARVADRITRFAGSMRFVYLHVVWFALWVLLGVEPVPFASLTLIVSLEAIFLSAFVLITQNRADEKRSVIAEHQWDTIQLEERQMQELLAMSRQILSAVKAQQRTAASGR